MYRSNLLKPPDLQLVHRGVQLWLVFGDADLSGRWVVGSVRRQLPRWLLVVHQLPQYVISAISATGCSTDFRWVGGLVD